MSLSDRIANDQIKNAQLLLQNDRISIASRSGEKNKILTLKPVDEELLKEYNAQFPKSFEYTDPTGNKVNRKYVPVGEAPDLDEIPTVANGGLEHVYDTAGLKQLDKVIQDAMIIRDAEIAILRAYDNALQQIDVDVNQGKLAPADAIKQKRDIDFEKRESNKIITKAVDDINNAFKLKNDNDAKKIRNQGKIAVVNEKNKGLIKNYSELLYTLNRGAFNTQQQVNETDDEYLQRLKQNAEIEAPQESIDDMKLLKMKEFREKLKEIIRKPSIIEQVANSIDSFGNVDNKLKLLKQWNEFKTKFVKVYGINNTHITVDEILEYMRGYLGNNLPEEEEEQETERLKSVEEIGKKPENIAINELTLQVDDTNESMQVLNKATRKTMYLRYVSDQNNKILLYSFNDVKGSYKKWSIKPVRDSTGITEDDLRYYFQVPQNESLTTGIIKNMHEDYNIFPTLDYKKTYMGKTPSGRERHEYGYGLHPEKIPEHAQFGKVIILMKKLYYHNILAVKHHNGISINGMPNVKVSDKFVKIIMNLLEGVYPTHVEINGLKMNEKELYDRLIHLAGLHKTVAHNSEKTVNELKKRLELLEGEKGAGNNSPLLKKDVKRTLQGLKGFGVITNKDMISHLAQF